MQEVIIQICAVVIYILLAAWIFLKIRNMVLVGKYGCREIYKEIKRESQRHRPSRYLFKGCIITAITLGAYISLAIIILVVFLFVSIVTFFGLIFEEEDPNFYSVLVSITYYYFYAYLYIVYFLYLVVYALLARAIYINVVCYIQLKKSGAFEGVPVVRKIKFPKVPVFIVCGIFLTMVSIVLFLSRFDEHIRKNNTIDMEEVVKPAMNSSVTMTTSWYFFHEDKLYVYDYDKDELLTTDLSGKNQEVLTSSEDLRFAHFYMEHNGEVFYYTPYNLGIKKVNLETREIKDVVSERYYYLMPDTMNNGKILVNYENDYRQNTHAYFALMDLETGELSDGKRVNYISQQPYFYNMENGSVYYIDTDDDENYIYQDNEIIYTYAVDNFGRNEYDLAFVQDGYLFAVIANRIFKLDLATYETVEVKTLRDRFSLISSVREGEARVLGMEEGPAMATTHPLFTDVKKGYIYKFNSSTMTFEKIVEADVRGSFVQKYGEYYVFQTHVETVVYSDETGEYETYDSANYTVEGEYIYLMSYTGDYYHQKEDNLKFKMKKLLLEEAVE